MCPQHVCGILSQTVACDIVWSETFFPKNAPRRDRRRQNGRLRDLGQLELLFRTFKTNLRQLVAEGVVGLLEGSPRDLVMAASSLPMPTACEPWPGKRKVMGKLNLSSGPPRKNVPETRAIEWSTPLPPISSVY